MGKVWPWSFELCWIISHSSSLGFERNVYKVKSKIALLILITLSWKRVFRLSQISSDSSASVATQITTKWSSASGTRVTQRKTPGICTHRPTAFMFREQFFFQSYTSLYDIPWVFFFFSYRLFLYRSTAQSPESDHMMVKGKG